MLKLPFRWIITTVLWLGIWIPFYIMGFFVTWLGLIFLSRSREHMCPLFWFWDNSHGINGTIGYNNMKWVAICNQDKLNLPSNKVWDKMIELVDTRTGNERLFKNRWIWVTWRNPVSNLSLYLLGKKIKDDVNVKTYNIWKIFIEKVTSGSGWFYSFTIPYNKTRCFYYAFGWKYLDPAENRARFIYRISPYREIIKFK